MPAAPRSFWCLTAEEVLATPLLRYRVFSQHSNCHFSGGQRVSPKKNQEGKYAPVQLTQMKDGRRTHLCIICSVEKKSPSSAQLIPRSTQSPSLTTMAGRVPELYHRNFIKWENDAKSHTEGSIIYVHFENGM